jgi:leucyl-tRNA synthetase
MENYNPQKIEKKWQDYWEKQGLYKAEDFSKKKKRYVLVEFPYPSGDGLHVGHTRPYVAMDAISRKKRMEGYNVLFPIGWDAFGLPTENYAIKKRIHPQTATKKNIANFKKQIKSLGLSFDWSREINTTDPKYYKWTQWIFLKLFEKGLAYQAEIPVNWCPSCKIGLANEEVVEGKCERCGAEAEEKKLKQWMIKITAYADRLIDDLKKVDYPEKVKIQQINWIGRSEGTEIEFRIKNYESGIKVFTTRPDTLFGCTYLVLAPEHPIIQNLKPQISNIKSIEDYIEKSKRKSERERISEIKEKSGIEVKGIRALNSINNREIPIFVADYVLFSYGTGAIMAVPSHDQRDFDFAKRYNLPIIEVIKPKEEKLPKEISLVVSSQNYEAAYEGEGILINSGRFDGLDSEIAKERITEFLSKKNLARKTIFYKLRDWIFSRQHYWGEPIPIIHCEKCGVIPVPEEDLPVELPYIEKYQPTGTGESPLAAISEWVNVKCPKCGGPAKRETDTMPNWAGSNWYFIRYIDPKNDKALADKKKLKYWLPVDWYNGGFEHTNLHLLYSRFIYKFLFDIGIAPQSEPYKKRTSHGIVLAEDGRKMSKSFGNVINPDDIVKEFGADTLRLYEMFMGPFEQAISWSTRGVKGVFRFLERVWKLFSDCQNNKKSSKRAIKEINKLNKKIENDLETIKFNTIVAAFMEFINFASENKSEIGKDIIKKILILLSPFVPHITEELWHQLGNKESIYEKPWPKYNKKLIKEEKITLVIQINGKVRDKIEVETSISEEGVKKLTLEREKVKRWIEGKRIKKVIFVPGKIINLVV